MRIEMRVIIEQRTRHVTGELVGCYGLSNAGRFVVIKPAQGKNLAGFVTLEAAQAAGIETGTALAAE